MFIGCTDKKENEQTFDEKIFQSYLDNNRIDKYNDLKEKYGDLRVILWYNEKEDAWWITNFTMWTMFSFLPDLPDVIAGGSILGLIYFIAWIIGVTLTGGGILGVLAYIGTKLYVIPGIAPAIMGIIYLGLMFSILTKIFRLLF